MSTLYAQGWVDVETTFPILPLPPNTERPEIRTERLLIRSLREVDLAALRELRIQPEVMIHTMRGRIDYSIEETKEALQKFLSPTNGDNFLFGIFLALTGELIGEGGVHTLENEVWGWPEIGYKFKKEHWGRGYATEFLREFKEAWWNLPRTARRLHVHKPSVEGEGEVVERVYADTLKPNVKSQKVLEKVGFNQFMEWTEPDKREDKSGDVEVVGFYLLRPDAKTRGTELHLSGGTQNVSWSGCMR